MPLPNDFTNDIIESLYTYANRKIKKYEGQPIYFSMTGEDVAHEAIDKILSGVRPWNKEKCPHLLVHLLGCAKSIISNHATLKETITIKRETDLGNEKKNENDCPLDILQMNRDQRNEEALSFYENREDALYHFTELMNYLSKNREDLIDFAEEILIKGRTKPKELALYFGITVKEVNIKKTALKRILIKLQEGES